MSGRKTFTAGEVLQAADVNDYLMDQSVMVFAGTAARGSAIPSPTEGMVSYLQDSDELQVYTTDWGGVGGGTILQVVSLYDASTFTTSSTSFVDITGITLDITPSSTSSEIMAFYTITTVSHTNPGGRSSVRLVRDGTALNGASTFESSDGGNLGVIAGQFPDSPASTSTLTYKLQAATNKATSTSLTRFTLILMEVAG